MSRTVGVDSEPESPSTDGTTTTAVATTTTEPLSDDEAAVLEAVRRFFEELPDRPDKTKTPDQYPDVLDEYITDPLLTRIREDDATQAAAGETVESYPSLYFVETVEIEDGEATVVSCDLARDATYGSDGDLLDASASIFTTSGLFLVKEQDGFWRTREWLKDRGDEKNCDPVLLWGEFDAQGVPAADPRFDDVGSPGDAADVERRFAEYAEVAGFLDERVGLPDASEDGFEAVASRHELYFMRDFIQTQVANTELDTVLGGWTYEIETTQVFGDVARLLMCAAPDLKFLSAADGSVIESDSRATWSIAFMNRSEGGEWLVEYFWFLGDSECAL